MILFSLDLLDLLNNIESNTEKKESVIPSSAVFPYLLGFQGYYFYSNIKLLQNPEFFEIMLSGYQNVSI